MTVIESSEKIIYGFKKTCFSVVEEIIIFKVFRKLEKDDFFLDWAVVFQDFRVKGCFSQKQPDTC